MTNGSRALARWFPYRKPQPCARLRLFCFAHAGGAASTFRDWQDLLPPQIEVCAVQLPGREARLAEQPFTSMDALAGELATVLEPLLDVRPAFFGHSLGAAIAFETAWRLSAHQGVRPAGLFVSARRAPHLSPVAEAIHLLPEPAFKQKLRKLGGTPEEALNNRELLDLILPILRADFELNDTFVVPRTRVPLVCPVFAFGGHEDTEVAEQDLDAWRQVTSGHFKLRMFSGGHFFLRENLPVVFREICESPLF